MVTYPEALAEQVASRDSVDTHTLRLSKSRSADLTETIAWLRDNGFKQVDYVYEPGQFSSRGSILDIYGYSNELPFRLDFFGDDIDSIRSFNVDTQLSAERFDDIAISANVAIDAKGQSLLEYIPANTIIAVRDFTDTALVWRPLPPKHYRRMRCLPEISTLKRWPRW